jgi:hypothetical protein
VHLGADTLELLDHEPPTRRRLQRNLETLTGEPTEELTDRRAICRRTVGRSVAGAARDRDRAPHLQASQTPVEARSPVQLAKRIYGLGATLVEVGLAIKLSVHSSEAQILATLG